ncbi:receptor-transporting protein 3-like isoform X3 [Penaeus chinensis]|uniref:receptor-transporting protein 3-like isoform X3 n=1 Tax=Penaeus chinensis TaxID=139456 RepID=UPI001FB62BE7|nr:receptor-transporting protein 3-like isoform X3 [Penaeus chinensis]
MTDLLQPCLPVQRLRAPPTLPGLSHPRPPSQAEKKPFLVQQRSIHGPRDLNHQIECLYGPFQPFGCRPVLLQLTGSTIEPGLEQVWNQHFELLFRTLPNVWYFGPIQKTPTGWSVFKDMAKVRFSCQRCSHGWTSMYGLVVFYYRWDAFLNQGHVRFILTGQKCNQCERSAFETPMWYPEEAQKVMTNLYHEVANRVYGLQTPPLIRDRRHGRPRQQHNSSMCEGCHQGICKAPRNTVPSASS